MIGFPWSSQRQRAGTFLSAASAGTAGGLACSSSPVPSPKAVPRGGCPDLPPLLQKLGSRPHSFAAQFLNITKSHQT